MMRYVVIALLILVMLLLRKRLVWAYRVFVRPWLSLVANYSVYYFRRSILFQSAEKARRNQYTAYAENQADLRLRRLLPNIVVANSNRDKYTETFVRRHINGLRNSGFYVHQLYGGELPTAEVRSGLLLSNSSAWRTFYTWMVAFFDLPSRHFERKAFKDYLVKNDVKMVVAEFGTCGAQIFDLCEEAKVPLVVIFHGYDAHHERFVTENIEHYKRLFQSAAQILCVSEDIRDTLSRMGCPAQKLVHLPCGLDAERFAYSDHSTNPAIFLAVGRFAETKAPHITILAFNEVLQSIPDAKLVMIGKDGGGELFEACHILVRSLGIEKNVIFKGVLSPDEVLEEMHDARVFVQHSVTTPINHDREGTPVSIMEAMSCGLPIVATRHAGIAELIEHGYSGILVEEYDYKTMASEMLRICQSDKLVFTFGKQAAERINNHTLVMNSNQLLAEIVEKYRNKE
jgi:colanic acid/amylovoran biosynthesis glycosyltransferase